jgi:hypothetical protein
MLARELLLLFAEDHLEPREVLGLGLSLKRLCLWHLEYDIVELDAVL